MSPFPGGAHALRDAHGRRGDQCMAVSMVALLLCCVVSGCAAAPQARTTFLNSIDLIEMTDRMAQSLTNDEVIARRSANDDPWVISIYRVRNHTNQIIPENEKWLYVARLRAQLAQTDFARERSIIWVMPPEKWAMVAEEIGGSREPYGLRMRPTHQLTAQFNALTNTMGIAGGGPGGRSDFYHCAYQLFSLETGTVIWEDKFEVKRAVTGLTYD